MSLIIGVSDPYRGCARAMLVDSQLYPSVLAVPFVYWWVLDDTGTMSQNRVGLDQRSSSDVILSFNSARKGRIDREMSVLRSNEAMLSPTVSETR